MAGLILATIRFVPDIRGPEPFSPSDGILETRGPDLAAPARPLPVGTGPDTSPKAVPTSEQELIDWAVASLRAEFADTITLKRSHVALARLRLFLAERYPKTWKTLFQTLLERAFPDQTADILATLNRLDTYEAWLEAKREDLTLLDHDQLMDRLWAKRLELFGDEARDMWAEETRTEAIIDVLDIMREAYDTSLDEKLNLFVQAIKTSSQDNVAAFMANKKIYLTRAFLRMDSVQENLKSMTEQDRAQHLQQIRLAMGFTEQEIETLARADAKNEARWQKGYRYMDERSRLLAQAGDTVPEQALAALRERYFQNQAATIQAEEASGFFRFTRPRIHGCN